MDWRKIHSFVENIFYVKVCQDFYKNPEFVQEHSDLRNKFYRKNNILMYLSQNFKFRACLFSPSSWILCELYSTQKLQNYFN